MFDAMTEAHLRRIHHDAQPRPAAVAVPAAILFNLAMWVCVLAAVL